VVKPGLARVVSCRASAVLLGTFTLFLALPAWACPSCTTRSSGGYMIPILLGAFILTPYVVSTVVLRIIRKAESERAREEETMRRVAKTPTSNQAHAEPAANIAPVGV
jgi:hypothetical protein